MNLRSKKHYKVIIGPYETDLESDYLPSELPLDEEIEIDFDGSLKVRLCREVEGWRVIKSMDGWGNWNLDEIQMYELQIIEDKNGSIEI